jgi:hypothetical protein
MLASCGPPAAQPWFNETIVLDDHELPSGIEIKVIRENYKSDFQNYISISNSTSNPVYIPVVAIWSNNTSLINLDEPCPNNNNCIKVLANQHWEWMELDNDEGLSGDYDWVLADNFSNSDLLTLDLYCGGIHSTNYIVKKNECKNKYDYGQGRPKNIEPLEPQIFYLHYILNGNEDSIGVTIHYSINENYKRDFSFEATGLLSICSGPAIGLIVVALFAFAVLLISRFGKAE